MSSIPSSNQPATLIFDVCHAALAWRAVLGVNIALALGVLAASNTGSEAMAHAGPWLLAGVAATSLWLGVLCALKARLARMSRAGQWSVAVLLGAWMGCLALMAHSWLAMAAVPPIRFIAAAGFGAVAAGAMTVWLEQRQRATKPAQAHARLAELQARIRPHFLFNTLNTATALVRVDPAAAERMLEDLSDLFRAALAEAKVTTLADELQVAQQYLAIEQRRFGDRMSIAWDLDPRAHDAPLPSLVLQPLMENAVHHGVESMPQGAWIRVVTRMEGDMAHVEVHNNVGEPTTTGSGMALANVRERLRLMHDLDGRFQARHEAERFVVRIGVPLKMTVTA